MKKQAPALSSVSDRFEGFPSAGFSFLRSLKKNNEREWFQPRKATYQELLVRPLQLLTAELGQELQEEAPGYSFDPKRSIFRIYRDTRFSGNQDPYKTHIAASYSFRTAKKEAMEEPGFYFHLEPGSVFVGGGIYMPSSAQLRLIRDSILSRPEAYLAVVKNPAFRKRFGGIAGENLKRAPQGMDPEHPLIEHLRHKQFYVGVELDPELAQSRKLIAQVVRDYRLALPLLSWLRDATAPLRFKNR